MQNVGGLVIQGARLWDPIECNTGKCGHSLKTPCDRTGTCGCDHGRQAKAVGSNTFSARRCSGESQPGVIAFLDDVFDRGAGIVGIAILW